MQYIPCTDEQEKEFLKKIGVTNYNKLIEIVPDNLRMKNGLNLQQSISEIEAEADAHSFIKLNKNAMSGLCFMGSGVYDHYVPKAVDAIANRSEFYTAYTPYQAEVSQGTLQYLYEFQTMICQLSGMDVSNASLYDGASAVAEGCSLAISYTRKNKIALSRTLNSNYSKVVECYLQNRGTELIYLDEKNGRTDLSQLKDHLDQLAAVVIQSPNYFGLLEDWQLTKNNIQDSDALLIAVSDPICLSILKPPSECGADIYAGEGQSLGNYMSYGGPFVGLLAAKINLLRKMPGRIVGKTYDKDGKEGFVLTLQTREQHIRRENATSNICTNQGLIALRATIYMSLMGKRGLPKLARLCSSKAQYTSIEISKLSGYSLPFDSEIIKEFVVKCPSSASKIKENALIENIFVDTVINDSSDSLLLIAVTEKRTKEEIDKLINFLKSQL